LKNPSHGIRLPEAYLIGCEFDVPEAAMNSAPSLDSGIKDLVESSNYLSATGKVEGQKISHAPRLEADDLDNPSQFHRRLVEWLMKQH
jgi:hypothetical protein